jgi:hypothetical protein
VGRKEAAVLGRRAHGELIHVRLAEQHGTGRGEAANDGAILDRDEVVEDARPGRGARALGDEDVFERHGDAEQRARLAGCQARIGALGLCPGELGGHSQERADRGI